MKVSLCALKQEICNLNKYDIIIYQLQYLSLKMSQELKQNNAEAIKNKRWAQISGDQDDSQSEKEQVENMQQQKHRKQPQVQSQLTEQKNEKKDKKDRKDNHQQRIKPFDARINLRGGHPHMKTVKGGFKAEKMEKKVFHLNEAKNPFALDESESEEEIEEEVKEEVKEEKQEEEVKPIKKMTKKELKKKQQQEMDAAFAELGIPVKQDQQKKKKKKKTKKAEVEKNETKVELKQQQQHTAADFEVDKAKLEQLFKKKAEASKKGNKKSKASDINASTKKAIEQRQGKNKNKKVYVDL